MEYKIHVLISADGDERWYTGTAITPPGLAPSGVAFPGEGEMALFPTDAPGISATIEETDPDADGGTVVTVDETGSTVVTTEADADKKARRK